MRTGCGQEAQPTVTNQTPRSWINFCVRALRRGAGAESGSRRLYVSLPQCHPLDDFHCGGNDHGEQGSGTPIRAGSNNGPIGCRWGSMYVYPPIVTVCNHQIRHRTETSPFAILHTATGLLLCPQCAPKEITKETPGGSSQQAACYQVVKWWRGAESNRRHYDFQSYALPTELPRHAEGHDRGRRAERRS